MVKHLVVRRLRIAPEGQSDKPVSIATAEYDDEIEAVIHAQRANILIGKINRANLSYIDQVKTWNRLRKGLDDGAVWHEKAYYTVVRADY